MCANTNAKVIKSMSTSVKQPLCETRGTGVRFLAGCLPGRHLIAALLAGFGLRLLFILKFPGQATDTRLYDELARNWLYHRVYGVWSQGRLVPVDARMPGYPAFLAMMHAIAGSSWLAVVLAQAVLDLGTCVLVAFLAVRVAAAGCAFQVPGPKPPDLRRVAVVALWLAALCPFTANYTAVLLTETLAVLLTTLALLLLAAPLSGGVERAAWDFRLFWGALVVGLATLVRPETPLLLLTAGLVLLVRWRRPRDWTKLARAAALMAAGLLLPLLPWAVRNWRTLGEAQFLCARYAQLPGQNGTPGFYDWARTWQTSYDDAEAGWKLEEEPIRIEDVPSKAFDSAAERDHVAHLLDQYNESLELPPQLDGEFELIARERTRHHPLRTWLWLPFRRAFTMWFHPRIELLPYSGKIFPLAVEWDEDRDDLLVTLGLGALNLVFIVLALAGIWKFRHSVALALPVAFVLIRTVFFTQLDAPEPRYLLQCYPVVLVLAALAFSRRSRQAISDCGFRIPSRARSQSARL
jgi:hypothetical protein